MPCCVQAHAPDHCVAGRPLCPRQIAFLAADGTAVEHTVVVKPQARTELPEFVGADAPVAVVLNWNDHAFVKVRVCRLV